MPAGEDVLPYSNPTSATEITQAAGGAPPNVTAPPPQEPPSWDLDVEHHPFQRLQDLKSQVLLELRSLPQGLASELQQHLRDPERQDGLKKELEALKQRYQRMLEYSQQHLQKAELEEAEFLQRNHAETKEFIKQ